MHKAKGEDGEGLVARERGGGEAKLPLARLFSDLHARCLITGGRAEGNGPPEVWDGDGVIWPAAAGREKSSPSVGSMVTFTSCYPLRTLDW